MGDQAVGVEAALATVAGAGGVFLLSQESKSAASCTTTLDRMPPW
jgi:hypothetical protein